MLKKELLDILCCPECKAAVRYDARAETLTCVACGHVYRVKDGIPIMLVDDKSPSA